MRVRVTPQYLDGQKLSDRQKANAPKLIGMLTFTHERGRSVMKLGSPTGGDKPPPRLLWNPVHQRRREDERRRVGASEVVLRGWHGGQARSGPALGHVRQHSPRTGLQALQQRPS
jgi:hypothetical protein